MITSIRKRGIRTSLALIGACAACCALPLLGMLGFGAVTTATFSSFLHSDLRFVMVAGAFTALAALVVIFLRRAARTAGCKTECAVDRSCCGQGSQQSSAD